jgi:F0F1-type ATP synthase assembly protein I
MVKRPRVMLSVFLGGMSIVLNVCSFLYDVD